MITLKKSALTFIIIEKIVNADIKENQIRTGD